jgi:NAD(P)-dependent dehydrogenase (short-subunit alcohol dehydrogenase family)
VVVVEPGGIQTEWGGIAADNLRKVSGQSAYARQAQAMAKAMDDESSSRLSAPSVIADVIAKAVTARRPATRYVAGYGARPLIFLRRVLPDRAFDRVIRRAVRVPAR